MAMMAAAMSAAFREDRYRSAGMQLPGARSRSRAPGPKRPAGAKLLRRYYKAHHGVKPESLEEARRWYAAHRATQDAAVRATEAKRKAARALSPLPLAA